MCDIFPEVANCCLIISLRIGMLLISVIAIMTGGLTLCVIEHGTNASVDDTLSTITNMTTNITKAEDVIFRLGTVVPTAATCGSCLLMATGLILMFATLTDQEGFVQIFVWVMFANIILGFILVLIVTFNCTFRPTCALSALDWLTGGIVLVAIVLCLFIWLYFIVVANSYVLLA